jgi:hypothetical protein
LTVRSGWKQPVVWAGFGLVALALEAFLLYRWFDDLCWETDQPCQGRVIAWLPWALLEGAVLALVIFGAFRLVRWIRRRTS